jgi:hypothetical protein
MPGNDCPSTITKHYDKVASDLRDLMDERDKRYVQQFSDNEKARGLALSSLQIELNSLRAAVPTAQDHLLLVGKVENLEKTAAIGEGKSSQNYVNVVLAVSIIGLFVSLCMGGLTLVTLLSHLFNIF